MSKLVEAQRPLGAAAMQSECREAALAWQLARCGMELKALPGTVAARLSE